MRISLLLFYFCWIFKTAQGQLPLGAAIPALQAGNAALDILPPQARECVNKVTTKAVGDSLVGKFTGALTQMLGSAAPTITRDPGRVQCKGDKPYYSETAHIKTKFANLPLDLPITTDSDLSTCLPGPLNFCKLLGNNGGTLAGNSNQAGGNAGNVLNGLLSGNSNNAGNPNPAGGNGNAFGHILGAKGK